MTDLTREEIVEETVWLLDNGMSPYYIPTALNKSPGALYKALWRAGRKDLYQLFDFQKASA